MCFCLLFANFVPTMDMSSMLRKNHSEYNLMNVLHLQLIKCEFFQSYLLRNGKNKIFEMFEKKVIIEFSIS